MWINSLVCRCKPWNNSAKCKLLNSNRLWSGFRRENFAWFCVLELPLADLAQDGQGVEMEELQSAHAAELQRLQTQHQVATVYWNETGFWSGSKQLFPRKWCNNVQHLHLQLPSFFILLFVSEITRLKAKLNRLNEDHQATEAARVRNGSGWRLAMLLFVRKLHILDLFLNS